MRYVITHDIPHIPAGEQDAHNRINKIEVVTLGYIGSVGKRCAYEMNKILKKQGGETAQHANHKSQNNDKRLLADVTFTPKHELESGVLHTSPKAFYTVICCHVFTPNQTPLPVRTVLTVKNIILRSTEIDTFSRYIIS